MNRLSSSLFVIVALAIASVLAQCPTVACVGLNAPCDPTAICNNPGDPACSQMCPLYSWCSPNSSTCVDSALNTGCLVDSDCNPPTTSPVTALGSYFLPGLITQPRLQCSFGLCILDENNLVTDDPCDSNAQCSTSECKSGICRGAKFNAPCGGTGECEEGLGCVFGTCRPLSGNNEPCNSDLDCKHKSSYCNPASSVCRPRGELDLGEACSGIPAGCEPDLGCFQIGDGSGTSICATAEFLGQTALENQACVDDSNCNSTAFCACNTGSATLTCQAVQDCREYENAYLRCLDSRECNIESEPRVEISCAGKCANHAFNFGVCTANNLQNQVAESCFVQRDFNSASALSWAFDF